MAAAAAAPRKIHASAVCLVPPKALWPAIQAIRRQHDKSYERWPPHVNLLYPFHADGDGGDTFRGAAGRIAAALRAAAATGAAFTRRPRLRLGPLQRFEHKRSVTLWLGPHAVAEEIGDAAGAGGSDPSSVCARAVRLAGRPRKNAPVPAPAMRSQVVNALQACLQAEFPDCDDLSTIGEAGFTPHLSVGQCRSARAADALTPELSAALGDLSFEATHVCLISRPSFESPFCVRFAISLDGTSVTEVHPWRPRPTGDAAASPAGEAAPDAASPAGGAAPDAASPAEKAAREAFGSGVYAPEPPEEGAACLRFGPQARSARQGRRRARGKRGAAAGGGAGGGDTRQ